MVAETRLRHEKLRVVDLRAPVETDRRLSHEPQTCLILPFSIVPRLTRDAGGLASWPQHGSWQNDPPCPSDCRNSDLLRGSRYKAGYSSPSTARRRRTLACVTLGMPRKARAAGQPACPPPAKSTLFQFRSLCLGLVMGVRQLQHAGTASSLRAAGATKGFPLRKHARSGPGCCPPSLAAWPPPPSGNITSRCFPRSALLGGSSHPRINLVTLLSLPRGPLASCLSSKRSSSPGARCIPGTSCRRWWCAPRRWCRLCRSPPSSSRTMARLAR